jgi:hypothetical protein
VWGTDERATTQARTEFILPLLHRANNDLRCVVLTMRCINAPFGRGLEHGVKRYFLLSRVHKIAKLHERNM